VGTLKLRIVPNAKRAEVVGKYGDAVKLKVAAPAMDGKANNALLEFIAEKLGVSARSVSLLMGDKSRDKVVAVEGVESEELRRRLLGGEP
jgi:uncharacterized protein (TIGR00251 family)